MQSCNSKVVYIISSLKLVLTALVDYFSWRKGFTSIVNAHLSHLERV